MPNQHLARRVRESMQERRRVQKIVADLLAVQHQYRYQVTISAGQLGGGIDINCRKREAGLGLQHLHFDQHLVAQMAALPTVENEVGHGRPGYRIKG